jgi:hypothetical protein
MRVNSRVIVVGSLALGFAFGNLAMSACDNIAPSESVGACKDDVVLCSSYDSEADCLNNDAVPSFRAYIVNEDFPTSCVTSNDRNCNQPLKNCYRATGCVWSNDKCVPNSNNVNPWIKKTKRESEFCGSADPNLPQ